MPKIHPDELTLKSLTDAARAGGFERTLAHVAGCRRCQERLSELLDPRSGALSASLARVLRWPGSSPDYTQAIRRGSRDLLDRMAALEQERAEAREAREAFNALMPAERHAALEREPHLRTWGFVELLLAESRERTYRDPLDGERFAEHALAQSERLDDERYGAARLHDLAARCHARIANARRVRSDLMGADKAFAQAEDCLRLGTRDPLERAEVWLLKASLRRDQRRLDDAARLFQRAIETFERAGDRHRAGSARVALANVARTAGSPERAIALLQEALPDLDVEAEPRLEFCARHNLISFLAESGQFLAARRLLSESLAIYRRFPEPWAQLRRAWVEGRIAAGLGQLAAAESALLGARDGFVAAGMPYDAAQVALELAAIYARTGRHLEVAEIGRATLALFTAIDVPREALVALGLLAQAAEREQAALAEVIHQAATALASGEPRAAPTHPMPPDESES